MRHGSSVFRAPARWSVFRSKFGARHSCRPDYQKESMRSILRHHPLTSGVLVLISIVATLTFTSCGNANSKSAQASVTPPSIPVAVAPAEPVEHEVGEEQLALGPGQRVLDPLSVQPHEKPAAELDSRLARLCHPKQA